MKSRAKRSAPVAFLLLFAALLGMARGQEPLTIHASVPDGPAAAGATAGILVQITNRTGAAAGGVAFSMDLPTGLVLANPSTAGNVCDAMSVTAAPGTTNFAFSGGAVPANSTCAFTVNVMAGPTGDYRITTGEATSDIGTACPSATVLSVKTDDVLLGSALEATVEDTRVTFDLLLENLDAADITELSALIDLDAALGFQNYRVVTPPSLLDGPTTISANTDFDGAADQQLIRQSEGNGREADEYSLEAGGTVHIQFAVDVVDVTDSGSGIGNFEAQAEVSGRASDGVTEDLSDEGSVANPGGPGNDDPTAFSIGVNPAIGAAQSIRLFSESSQPRFQLLYAVENLGEADVTDVSVVHDLDSIFGAGNYSFTGPRRSEIVQNGARMSLNPAFNGSSDVNLFLPGGALSPGERVVVTVEITVNNVTDQGFGLGVYQSQFSATANSITGPNLSDLSDAGLLPDTDGDGVADEAGENDPLIIAVASKLGVATDVSVTGTTATLDYYLEVFGPADFSDLSLVENLDNVFGSGNYTVDDVLLIDDPGTIGIEMDFDGSENVQLLAANSTLAAGETAQIRVVVSLSRIVNQGAGLGAYTSDAVVSGTQFDNIVTIDTTTAGTDPDPNGNGIPDEVGENGGSMFTATFDAIVGGAHTAMVAGNRVTFDIYLENLGSQTATALLLPFDLDEILGEGNYDIVTAPAFVDDPGTIILNGSFDGSDTPGILSAGSTLAVGDTAQVRLEVDITTIIDPLEEGPGVYESQFSIIATDSSGLLATDLSTEGTEPDPNSNGDPTEDSTENVPTPFIVGESSLGLSLRSDVDGTEVIYTYTLQNLGDVPISDITLQNPLNSVFGSGNYSIQQQPTLIEGPDTLFLSPQYFGFSVFDRVIVGGSIAAGETIRLTTRINVSTVTDQGNGFGIYNNQLTVYGQNLDGAVSDLSDDGLFPDSNGNGTADDADESDPTATIIGDEARIGLAESATPNGTSVDLDIFLENLGGSTLSNLSLEKNLDDVFGAGNYSVTSAPSFVDDPGTIALNGGYDGSTDTQLFSAGSTLVALDTATIRIGIDVTTPTDRGFGFGNYRSQSQVSAQAPLGSLAFDISDSGTNPDPNDNGIAFEGGENDPLSFSTLTSNIGVALAASVDGREVTFDYTLSNLGDVTLSNLSVPHDLDAVFGAGNYTVTVPPFFPGTFRNLELNTAYNGSSDTQLIGGGTLGAGATERFRIVVRVDSVTDQGSGAGMYTTQVSASGDGSLGMVADTSDDGDETDPDGNGQADGTGEDDSTTFSLQGSVGDLVWNDINGNGVFDGGEPGIQGVTVFIDLNTDGALDPDEPSATSDASGAYTIPNLMAGSYSVRFDPSSVPSGFTPTGGDLPLAVTIGLGENFDAADFGFVGPQGPMVLNLTGRPDLRIGEKRNPNSHKGDNDYGGGQKLNVKTTKRSVRIFFSLENDGNATDRIVTEAKGLSSRNFRIQIRDLGGGNATGAFLRNGYASDLESGAQTNFQLKATKKSSGSSTLRSRIEADSNLSPGTKDQIKFKFRFREKKTRKPTSLF